MSFAEILHLWSDNTAVSLIIWFFLLTLVAYFARVPSHHAILSLSRMLQRAMQLASHSTVNAESRLSERNREVLLAAGREAAERMVEREFERVDATVNHELAKYPSLHRQLNELVGRIEKDYEDSSEVPPPPSGWVKAAEAVAKIPSNGDPTVATVLKSIHESLIKSQGKNIAEYRSNSAKRHRLLRRMLPYWNRLSTNLRRVDNDVNSLLDRTKVIDRHMDDYEQISKGTDQAVRKLSSSSLTQFFIAGLVLVIAIGGAMVNFNLIARPMQEMVGGSSLVMGYQIANVAALVIILVEMAMGLFLMESLRITRLFPVIAALDDKIRVYMGWVVFAILFTLASVEAGLAYMREILAQDDAALRAALLSEGGVGLAATSHQWITTAAQMGMGFILPFALTFVAIPLESFVHSLRTVMGVVGVGALRVTAVLFRILGNVAHSAGSTVVHVYDLLIFGPLWLEKRIKGRAVTQDSDAQPGDAPLEAPPSQAIHQAEDYHATADASLRAAS